MELVGTLTTLRPWRLADAPSLVKYANNPNVARQLREGAGRGFRVEPVGHDAER